MQQESKLDDLKKETELLKKVEKENQLEFIEVCNRFFSSPDGKKFWKRLVIYCGLFNIDNSPNNDILRENNGKRKVITELLLPNIDKKIRMELLND